MEIVFEIAVYQQTRTNDQNFEGSQTTNRPPMPAVQLRPYLVYFWPIMQNHCNIHKPHILDAVLVAIGLLNWYLNFHPDWTKIVELWAKNHMPINWSNINILNKTKLYMKGMPKLHILCNY